MPRQDIFPIDFWKMNGAGNDFIVIDHRDLRLPLAKQPDIARRLCRRMFSIGADGLILIEPPLAAGHDFSWRFYNADGSEAEMCGNGARCAARFAFAHAIAGRTMRFATKAGIVAAEMVDATRARVFLADVNHKNCRRVALTFDGREFLGCVLTVGVPHLVLFMQEENIPVVRWGREARRSPLFQPAGVNVDFVWRRDGNQISVRTYERGVEDETMACGTGATAAAICAVLEHGLRPPVTVQTAGGEELIVNFVTGDDGMVAQLSLEGTARLVYRGSATNEAFA